MTYVLVGGALVVKKSINVIVNMPNEEYASKLMADVIADLIIDKISKYDVEVQKSMLKELQREIKKEVI